MPSIVPRTRTASCATAVALREPSTTPASAITIILLAHIRFLPLIGGKIRLGNNWTRQRFLFFRPLDSHSVTSFSPPASATVMPVTSDEKGRCRLHGGANVVAFQ